MAETPAAERAPRPAPPESPPEREPLGRRLLGSQKLAGLLKKAWWFHSFFALAFGIGVMLFARRGLDYADKVLMVLALSWFIVFIAFRFIVGAQNRAPEEKIARKGLRLVTNYVIKQLYQQMFFFLVPLYASSATWSLTSPNWWLVPILLAFAVLSTLDLVFDNFIMEHRVIASAMYGFCMFGVLNLVLPLVFRFDHFEALVIAALATAPTIALLSFRLRAVFSIRGLTLLFLTTGGSAVVAVYGRIAIPPAPLAMSAGAIGHGRPGEFECVPGPKRTIPVAQLREVRCVTQLAEPGGLKDSVVHVWRHNGVEILRQVPLRLDLCEGMVFRTMAPPIPEPAIGLLTCTVETAHGQLVGRAKTTIVPITTAPAAPEPSATP